MRVVTEACELGDEAVDVVGALGEHQTGSSGEHGAMNVSGDLLGALPILDGGPEDRVYPGVPHRPGW